MLKKLGRRFTICRWVYGKEKHWLGSSVSSLLMGRRRVKVARLVQWCGLSRSGDRLVLGHEAQIRWPVRALIDRISFQSDCEDWNPAVVKVESRRYIP